MAPSCHSPQGFRAAHPYDSFLAYETEPRLGPALRPYGQDNQRCVCARARVRVCICNCVKCILYLRNLHTLAFFLSVIDHLLPRTIHSLKNQSLDVLGLVLSLKSPSTVELFRTLPQSRLKEFQFISCDEQVVRLCCSQMCLLLNSLL